jgi:hypothetical protein
MNLQRPFGMAAPRQGLPVRLERAPHRGAAFALSNASERARTRSIGSRSPNDHALGLGWLMGYLQSLEATIRIFLSRTDPSKKNYIISGDTLGPLIEKYNGQLTSNEPYSIDQQVVTIRNALAHGLVIAPSNMSLALAPVMSLPLTLFHDGQSYVMTVDWFQDQQTLAQAQINRILACATKRGIKACTHKSHSAAHRPPGGVS